MPDLTPLFFPASVAIVGASSNPQALVNRNYVRTLLDFGYKGRVYPVNPHLSEVMGMTAYPSLLDVPEPVDYVVCGLPARLTPGLMEPYAESPGGQREVQYYDKSRMEITQPTTGDPDSVWFVTNGLLVNELMTGQLQLGDNSFQQHSPAEVNVGGDPDDVLGPTYASMAGLRGAPALPSGSTITQTVDRNGNVSNDPGFGQYNVTAANRCHSIQLAGVQPAK